MISIEQMRDTLHVVVGEGGSAREWLGYGATMLEMRLGGRVSGTGTV